jgi:hypothetical protein
VALGIEVVARVLELLGAAERPRGWVLDAALRENDVNGSSLT